MFEHLSKIIPSSCISCSEPVHEEPLCSICMSKLSPVGEFVLKPKPAFRYSFAGFSYEGAIVDLIHRFKYENGAGLSKFIIKLISPLLDSIHACDVLVPIPLSEKKLIKRGYNQAKLLAGEISKRAGIKVFDALLCSKDISQIGMGRKERFDAVRGIYTVGDESVVKGKTVLLVDDVMTTGATLSECAKVLKRSGCKSVDVLVAAKTR